MDKWNRKRRVAKDYTEAAHLYDMRYTAEQTLKIKSTIEVLRAAKQTLILDIGCGTGLLIPELRSTVKCASPQAFVGLDLSKEMLTHAKKLEKSFADIHFLLADADHSPLRGNQFDLVFAFTVLQNMPAPINTLREAQRVTKEDGVLVVTGFKKHWAEPAFVRMLQKAKLSVEMVKPSEEVRDHIAICRKQI